MSSSSSAITLDQPLSERAPSFPDRLGPFEIDGVLGEGGSGVVYAARRDGREVALKVPHPDREIEDAAVVRSIWRRFVSEARMMAKVRHPHVVEVIDAGMFDDGRPYVAMERLEGCSLAERIAERGALALSEALALFAQLGEATAALHDAGLVHRDIKAENVFLVDAGRTAKLLDFGIAKDRTLPYSSTTTGIVRGTPATMAPERFFGKEASEASDVYELGVVLYVMLAGRLPWAGDETDVDARLYPLTLRQLGVDVPETLSQEIVAALSTRPEQRPQSVRELVERVRGAAVRPNNLGSGATVTSEHLKALVEHRTPLGTAVTSSPRPLTKEVAPRVPRSWLGVAGLAAAIALAFGAAHAGDGVAAQAVAGWAEPLSTLASDGAARINRGEAPPVVENEQGSDPSTDAAAEADEPTSKQPARASERTKAARGSAGASNGASKSEAPAQVQTPESSGSSPIPGGVYETPPY